MMDYFLSPLAEADVDEIWLHIALDNSDAADRMIHRIFEAINLLVRTPMIGRSRDEVLPSFRSYGVPPYLVFYRIEPDAVEIVRILHGARDMDTIFN